MSYQRTTFGTVKHLLPADAWAAWRNELNTGEFENELVLVFKEAAVLDSLDLDAPFEEAGLVFLILVQGSLTVRQAVYCQETDGATGLIVLGDLCARNLVVGGQEIYVTGNLVVDEVFWGDYNHGDLHVRGAATAKVFAETDHYHVKIEGPTTFGTHLTPYGPDGRWAGLDAQPVRELFIPEFSTTDAEDGEVSLVRDQNILSRLRAGQSLLKPGL